MGPHGNRKTLFHRNHLVNYRSRQLATPIMCHHRPHHQDCTLHRCRQLRLERKPQRLYWYPWSQQLGQAPVRANSSQPRTPPAGRVPLPYSRIEGGKDLGWEEHCDLINRQRKGRDKVNSDAESFCSYTCCTYLIVPCKNFLPIIPVIT